MEAPNVKNTIVDKEKNIRFDIMAYRKLSPAEMTEVVVSHVADLRRKRKWKPKPGDRFIIVTIIGYDS